MSLITTPAATAVIGCAIRVHTALGPGLFESVYDRCLVHELTRSGIEFARQVPVGIRYEGLELHCGFRADFIVAKEVLVELKAVERVLDVHHAQVRTYLRCTGLRKGLLLNFNAPRLSIKSFVL
jgi:GxxExxY protein